MRLFFTVLACLICVSVLGQCSGNCYYGEGTYFHENGDKYEGYWMIGLYNGRGVYTFANGDVFKGKWENGSPVGKGDYILANGDHYKGKWSAGEIDFITIQIDESEEGNSAKIIENKVLSESSVDTSTGNSNSKTLKQNIRVRVAENKFHLSKVAVIGKEANLCDGSKDDGQSLAELVEGELLGIYGVVERRHLEEILNEQRLAMSGLLLEDSDFAQAGCLAGAQGTVIATYGCLQGQTKVQIKLVDCSTSDLYWSATGVNVSEFDLLDALRVELNK